MKILLGNPPWRDGNNYGVRAGSRWPHFHIVPPGQKIPSYIPFPFYLAYAAALLEKDQHQVKIVDAVAQGLNSSDFLNEVTEFDPELIVLEVSTPSIYQDLITAEAIKNVLPDSTLVFCGPHAEMSAPDFLIDNPSVDLVVFGEYEYTLRELAQQLNSLEGIKGLIFRKGEEVIANPSRPLIENIDELPYPARHHLPMSNYCDAPAGLPLPSAVIWGSRGCPFQCIFCVWPQLMYGGGQYRARDPIKVVDEMEYLIKEYGFKSVNFDDDTFNLGKQRMLKFAAEVSSRNLTIPWAIMARADTMDEETLVALKEAGLYSLKYGVESGCQELVNNAGKKLDLEKVKEIVHLTKKIGIKVHLTFSFGLPGENWQTVRQTIDLAKELDPFSVQFSIITPYPGSRYYEELEKDNKILTKDWSKYVGSEAAVFFTDEMSATDLQNAQRTAIKEWQDHIIHRQLNNGFLENAIRNLPRQNLHQITIIRTSPLPHLYEAIKALKAKYSLARITVIAQESVFGDLIEYNDIDRIITLENGFLNWHNLTPELQSIIQSESTDLIMCLYSTASRRTYCDVEDILKKSKAHIAGGLTLDGEFLIIR